MNRSDFYRRYHAILEAIAGFVHMRAKVGAMYIKTEDACLWISRNLPKLYKETFGEDTPKPLKMWRVRTMLSNASYLGAYEEYDIKCVRGKGLTPIVKPRLRRVA